MNRKLNSPIYSTNYADIKLQARNAANMTVV